MKSNESLLHRRSTGIGLDLSCDLSLVLGPDLRQVETLLQVQPKLGTRSELTSQTERSLWSNGAAPMDDLPDARCRHADVHRELMLANLEWFQELLQQYFTGMSRNPLKRPT